MSGKAVPYVKAVVHLLCLLPFLYLLQMYRSGALVNEADPVNFITHFTGNWTLWILLADLAITPVRRISSKLAWLIRFRRMVGLYAFFYATLHLLTYVLLFSGFDVPTTIAGLKAYHFGEPWRQFKLVWPYMLDDMKKRRFIQVGLLAWTILLVLAVTSPLRVLRAMGGKNWQRLHRLIYVAGAAGVIHYWWLVKTGVRAPMKDTIVLVVLLLARVGYSVMKKVQKQRKLARVVVRATV